jgi:anti-anti-sigma factor
VRRTRLGDSPAKGSRVEKNMEIRVIESGDGLKRLVLAGRLDLAGTQAIEARFAALTAGAKQTAIVDLKEVTFLASLGMRMLVSNARALLKSGSRLVLLGPQPGVRLALQGAGLATILPIAADENEAAALATLRLDAQDRRSLIARIGRHKRRRVYGTSEPQK